MQRKPHTRRTASRRFAIIALIGCTLLFIGPLTAPAADVQVRLVDSPISPGVGLWISTPPADCPFPQSDWAAGLYFTGRHAEYTGADTWYPSWASDGNQYSPWTDGNVNGVGSSSGGDGATTGQATIVGDDPLKLVVKDAAVFHSSPRPYEGRYPCGSLVHNGVWYYGTYCLHPSASYTHEERLYNWPWLGPLVGFRWSKDFGKTWTETPCTPAKPLFGESALKGEPVKFGSAHFVDFGKNMRHSPDGKAYLVSQGASRNNPKPRYANCSWITGDEIYIARVTPSIETINDGSKYEFFANRDAGGKDLWSSKLADAKPIAAWNNNMGCVTTTYIAPLKKYLMCVTDGTDTVSPYNTYLLESDNVTGPWKLVTYMRDFGVQAYFVNIPGKFVADDGKTFWLCYSANFVNLWLGKNFPANPRGSGYAMCFQEVRLLTPGDPVLKKPDLPLDDAANVAPAARVTASSVFPDYDPRGAVDRVVDGFPGNIRREWASKNECEGAWLRLDWDAPQTVGRVWLFDRPNALDQVTSAKLQFSDGSELDVKTLPDDAKKGLELSFPAKKITWLKFVVTGVKPGSPNIGLAEIAVFRPNAGK